MHKKREYIVRVYINEGHTEDVHLRYKGRPFRVTELKPDVQNYFTVAVKSDNVYYGPSWENDMINGVLDDIDVDWALIDKIDYGK